MSEVDSRTPGVRWVLFTLAALALAAAVVTCKSVTDNVLGTRVGAVGAANCMSECAHAANDRIRAESELHVANVHACKGDADCQAREEVRHQAAVNAIQDGRKACQSNCHHQGGGNGGR